jgi:hypothetical protein
MLLVTSAVQTVLSISQNGINQITLNKQLKTPIVENFMTKVQWYLEASMKRKRKREMEAFIISLFK